MKLSEASFRDLYHRFCVISHTVPHDFFGEEEPENNVSPNAALAYPYIDRTAGLTFEVIAPAVLPSCELLHDYALLEKLNSRYIVRAGGSEQMDVFFLRNQEELRKRYRSHCETIDKGYSAGHEVEATRKIESIDHLRHRAFPDDVQTALFLDDGAMELVWTRLKGTTDNGCLFGELLNTPYGKAELVAGDDIELGLCRDSEGSLRLFSRESMAVNHHGRKRYESFKKRAQSEAKQNSSKRRQS